MLAFLLNDIKKERNFKMNKRKVFTLFIVLAMIMSMLSLYSNAKSVIDDRTKYYAVIFGTTPEEVIDAQNTNEKIVFERMLEGMLESRKFTNDMYNLENDIDTSNVELLLTVSECAELFGVTEQEVNEHIEICGVNVYNKFIKEFEKDNVFSSLRNSSLQRKTTVQYWDRFYNGATTGNIFVTKDSVYVIYRHGHAGIIQSHTGTEKYISEALGDRDDPADEVVCRALGDNTPNWKYATTLVSMYPNTVTTSQRVTAGNHTLYYTIADNYTYEFASIKANVNNSSYTKVNCVSLIYRVYKFMTQTDIMPQVGTVIPLLPSQIYYSPSMKCKYVDNEEEIDIHRTDNFESYEWGF